MAYSEQWEAINYEYNVISLIEREGFIKLSAKQINDTQKNYPNLKFEARLLTHYDNKEQQPQLFKDNGISILPINRGSYILGSFNPFISVGKRNQSLDNIELRKIKEKIPLTTITASNPDSFINETMGLNYAFAQGIIEDFVGEPLTATVAGRQRGGKWSYKIASKGKLFTLDTINPQIEIDAGFEGLNSLALFEAKNSLVNEFCLRQLYFPFRAWSQKTSKEVKSIFAAINNGEIFLYEYVFPNADIFEGECVRAVRYQVLSEVITENELIELCKAEKTEEPVSVPFPQANSILRTIDLIEYALNRIEGINKNDIAEHYGFDERQGDYYANSAVYLGFLSKDKNLFIPTDEAIKYSKLKTKKEKSLFIAAAILRHKAFSEVLELSILNNEIPDIDTIKNIVAANSYINSESTVKRRASTVKNWINWIYNLI